ncbi:hypothetical protein [Mesoaciditoga lauensis]|uniref:hypothetical protein n=1 Tax=Mesoaciditoga lauensis TaxID=1495039 RepID=UPI000563FF85|nr:hypothetical protein [Mesoaciditoga lauensis]
MDVLEFLRNNGIESLFISVAGFIIALWYIRGRIVDKKNVSKGYLKYFHDLFPMGMMLFGVYSSHTVEPLFGGSVMVLATFIYIVNYVAPSIDKYDNVHRTTILSLGYTRQEYAIRYLFPKTRRMWFSAVLNFFVWQWTALMWFDVLKDEGLKKINMMFLISSLAFMILGIVISILKNYKEE